MGCLGYHSSTIWPCQLLHPDPVDELSDDNLGGSDDDGEGEQEDEEEEEEGGGDGAENGGGGHSPMDVAAPGQFDDA